MTEPLLIRYE